MQAKGATSAYVLVLFILISSLDLNLSKAYNSKKNKMIRNELASKTSAKNTNVHTITIDKLIDFIKKKSNKLTNKGQTALKWGKKRSFELNNEQIEDDEFDIEDSFDICYDHVRSIENEAFYENKRITNDIKLDEFNDCIGKLSLYKAFNQNKDR